jgi:valyl-tRNA synthetase
VWSWWQDGSIHRASWPDAGALAAAGGDADPLALEAVGEVLAAVRKAKTAAKVSMRAPVASVVVPFAVPIGVDDLRDAGSIDHIETDVDGELTVTLAG